MTCVHQLVTIRLQTHQNRTEIAIFRILQESFVDLFTFENEFILFVFLGMSRPSFFRPIKCDTFRHNKDRNIYDSERIVCDYVYFLKTNCYVCIFRDMRSPIHDYRDLHSSSHGMRSPTRDDPPPNTSKSHQNCTSSRFWKNCLRFSLLLKVNSFCLSFEHVAPLVFPSNKVWHIATKCLTRHMIMMRVVVETRPIGRNDK